MSSNRELFLKHIAQTSRNPLCLEIVHAEGIYLHDHEGKAYIDLISGIGPSYLGHHHPSIVEAVHAQTDKYLHTMVYGEFVLSPQVRYAEALTKHLPEELNSVYFLNSGSEAVEAALKLAKKSTGRSQFISMKDAYHGSTQGAMSLNSDTYFTGAYRPLLPDVIHLDFNDETQLWNITEETAAVIVEPIKAESGIHVPTGDYLKNLRARCTEVGAILIFDEIQSAFGRTGALFAFQKYGVTPDVILLAKALGGGLPLGAMIADKALTDEFAHHPLLGHITTFGGHPLSCVAGLAAFEELLSGGYMCSIPAKEKMIEECFTSLAEFVEVRTAGLWAAIDLNSQKKVMQAVQLGLERGIFIDWFLFNDQSLRLAPPLIMTQEELDHALSTLKQIIIDMH